MRLGYTISLENTEGTYAELEPLYRRHYGEMQTRLAAAGIDVPDYAPRLDQYFAAARGGWLLNYVIRANGVAVGYSNVYLTSDMHNGELIAQEDTVYVHPDHRNGVGKQLVKHILADLKARRVKRVLITPVTDLRVGKIWKRMGFKETAMLMTYTFGDDDV